MSEQNENKTELQVETTPEKKSRPVTRRYNKNGKRRGKYAYAAPVGFLVSLLSIVGVVAIILQVGGCIKEKRDTTALKQELYYYLQPLLVYSPEPFDDAANKDQDAFLNAAAYKVMLEEQHRILHEEDETPQYNIEQELNCYFVPQEVVEEAYHELFGPNAKLAHRSVEGSGLEYSKTDKCYLIPIGELDTGYEFVIDKVEVYRDRYEVRVGFISKTDIKYDEHGEPIEPTADQAAYFQIYTLARNKDVGTYYIRSCVDEKK